MVDYEPDGALVVQMYKEYSSLQPALRAKKSMIDGHIKYGKSFSIPPELRRGLIKRSGLAEAILDVLSSRIVFQGYNAPDDLGIDVVSVMEMADFDATANAIIYDALAYGVGFCLIGRHEDGWQFMPLSPLNVYARFSPITREVTEALVINGSDLVSLYTNDAVYFYDRNGEKITYRGMYEVNTNPIVAVFNNNTTSQYGKSELSAGVRDAITAYSEIETRKAVSEELYSSRDATILGGDEGLLIDEDGRPTSVFSALMGQTRQILQPVENEKTGALGSLPRIEYAPQMDPGPFLRSLNDKLSLIGTLTSIPAHMIVPTAGLGAEAFNILEQRLIRSTERRIQHMRKGFKNIALKMFMMEYGTVPDNARSITVSFGNPATPTLSAAADAAFKLVGPGILSADSAVLLARMGFTAEEIETIKTERSVKAGSDVLNKIRESRRGLPSGSNPPSDV